MPPDPALIEEAKKAAAHYGIPENVFLQQIQTESGFNPNAFNAAGPAGGAIGIAQFIAPTAQQYNVNPYDPVQSLWGAAAYDADLYRQKGTWTGVLTGYGTVPVTGPQNQQQAAAVAAATAADAGHSNPLANAQPIAGPLINGATPVAFPFSMPGVGTMLGNAASGLGAFLWNMAIRIILVLIGLVLVWQGLAMMRGTSVKENITVVVKGAKARAKAKAA